MGTERKGAVVTIRLEPYTRLEITAIYPDESEDASPIAYDLEIWHRVSNETLNLTRVRKLLEALGGTSNLF